MRRWLAASASGHATSAGRKSSRRSSLHPLLQRALYKEYTRDDRPRLVSQMRQGLQYLFAEDIERLSELLDVDMAEKWGYRPQVTPGPLTRAA